MNRSKKKGQAVLEYALLIAILIGALLFMQNYARRGMQGSMVFRQDMQRRSITGGGDQLGDQYAAALTIGQETSFGSSDSFEITGPGWGAPTTWTWTDGTRSAASSRRMQRLEEKWP